MMVITKEVNSFSFDALETDLPSNSSFFDSLRNKMSTLANLLQQGLLRAAIAAS